MGGADQYQHSSGKVKFCGQLPSFDEMLSRNQVSYLLVLSRVIELREFKEKEKKNNMDR